MLVEGASPLPGEVCKIPLYAGLSPSPGCAGSHGNGSLLLR